MKASQVFGIILAIALITFAIAYPVPEKHVRVSDSWSAYDNSWSDAYGAEYLGGDAYNYIVEASLKGGYVSGVLAMKAITFVGGLLLLFLALYSHLKCNRIEQQTNLLSELLHVQKEQKAHMEQLSNEVRERFANGE